MDYLAAAEGYVAQNRHFPDAEQFGLFLAQYNVIDTSTRGRLPGTLLDPVLDELWTEHPRSVHPPGPGTHERRQKLHRT
ncbi:hypothetical protein ACIQWZ_39765 [Streptomyces sp. NPDC098077]|uniref:hypothetical protein n=1 Tax=Streptomyces sp. NPDC098077 TaxID=3366093 RepID=UPI0038102008